LADFFAVIFIENHCEHTYRLQIERNMLMTASYLLEETYADETLNKTMTRISLRIPFVFMAKESQLSF